jgi:hypothetical protein
MILKSIYLFSDRLLEEKASFREITGKTTRFKKKGLSWHCWCFRQGQESLTIFYNFSETFRLYDSD